MNAALPERWRTTWNAESFGHRGQAQATVSGLLHAADPTSRKLTLLDVTLEPTIYLIAECDSDEDVAKILHEFCEEIFDEQLAGWYREPTHSPETGVYNVFCQWFDYQHHSMLVDLCYEPLIRD